MEKNYCRIAIRKGILNEDKENLNYSLVESNNKVMVQFRNLGKKISFEKAYGKISSYYIVASKNKITIKFDLISEELSRSIKEIKTVDIKMYREMVHEYIDRTDRNIFLIINYNLKKIKYLLVDSVNFFINHINGIFFIKFIKKIIWKEKKEYNV
jgi:hypothetical protein